MDKIVITGGTGFIGKSLAHHLATQGYQPIIIARSAPSEAIDYPFIPWDGHTLGDWTSALEGAKAIVNLAGKTVDCVKTPDNCDLILRSRVDSTKAIGKALKKVEDPPKIWIQMSTAHIYGDPPSQVCTESSSFGYGLAPFVGQAWENTFLDVIPRDTRGVILRTSFVIGRNGGALKTLSKIARMGLGGKVGHGRQGMSWIHEDDLNELILKSIENDQYQGEYVASSPNPVSNKEFMRTLRRAIRMPIGMPTPEWMARFGARYLFKTDPELAIYGRYVKSERLGTEGFRFNFPTLRPAMEDLLRPAG